MKLRKETNILLLTIFAIVIIISLFFHFRIDLTSDHRYSISEPTKRLLKKSVEPFTVKIYLDGDLNSGFQRLRKSTLEMLEEMSVYAGNDFKITFENPSKAENNAERERNYSAL